LPAFPAGKRLSKDFFYITAFILLSTHFAGRVSGFSANLGGKLLIIRGFFEKAPVGERPYSGRGELI
jgi:hypothetical protein